LITNPIEKLRRGVEVVEGGDLEHRIEVRGHDEIARLTESFNEMVSSLHERTDRLNDTIAELESFSYSVSHDLRTPLRGIDGFSQLLLEEYGGELDERAVKYLERICSASQRMGTLIDDMLTLSRITRGVMRREEVDLSEMAGGVVRQLRNTEPGREVEFIIEDGMRVKGGDPGLVKSMLINLISNAWKFTGRVENAKIEFGVDKSGAERVFFIRDNGAGFDMAYGDKLFGPFQRLHLNSEFEGTGIGLAIVDRIVRRHGGSVWGEGEVGKGATFYFTL